jgi:hypothetical protein
MAYIIKLVGGAFCGTILESSIELDKMMFVDSKNRVYRYECDWIAEVDKHVLCNFVETSDDEEFDKEIKEGWKE